MSRDNSTGRQWQPVPDGTGGQNRSPYNNTSPGEGIDSDYDHADAASLSANSQTHLHPSLSTNPFAYPPQMPKPASGSPHSASPTDRPYDPLPVRPQLTSIQHGEKIQSDGSQDTKEIETSYDEFTSRNASDRQYAYGDSDVPVTKIAKFYDYLLSVSVVTRWIIYIIPLLAIIWIPGILSNTRFPNATVWSVGLLWWSIWLTICWAGWWAALAVSGIMPHVIRSTIGLVAVGTRRYIDWLRALRRYTALFMWSLAIWVSWNPIIDNNQRSDASPKSVNAINLIGRLLFSIFLSCVVLVVEKFAIQYIAEKFHETSYADRIAEQKFVIKSLVTLYQHSVDTPGRNDTLMREGPMMKGSSINSKLLFKKIRQGVRMAATTTTTIFGNVASEITGTSVLQPNSPQAMVKTALGSANKSRLLARRLFYSFAKTNSEYLTPVDISMYFKNPEELHAVFALFDKDSNGDVSRDEIEMTCLEFHREQLSLENSLQDLDSAVGRLDNILMSLYVVVVIILLAIALEAQLVTVVTGAGTLFLGLSWLVGGSLQEVLTSIIFLFIKHPFDVGDRVIISGETYTVKEIRLLSTVFLNSHSVSVQAPNITLNPLFIQNLRRSPQTSETFTFDVAYSTSFDDIELLRKKMLQFIAQERRDYYPAFDVSVQDFPDQEKMTLSVDIKYKSNSQQGSLKAKRRNKWICALKTALAEVKIYGSAGNPEHDPSITRVTKVPWEIVENMDHEAAKKQAQSNTNQQTATWNLRDPGMGDSGDVFGEAAELNMPSPSRGLSETHGPTVYTATGATQMPRPIVMPQATPHSPDVIELSTRK